MKRWLIVFNDGSKFTAEAESFEGMISLLHDKESIIKIELIP